MTTKRILLSLLGAGVVLTGCGTVDRSAGGANVQVEFQSPDEFTDLSRNYPRRGADEAYLSELQDYIERNGSNRLPAGHALALTVTDVDMAGDFEPTRGASFSDIRLIRAIYPPRIELSYRLTDSAGNVVSEGERRLTDTAFEWNVTPVDQDDPLRHEKDLLDEFLSDLAQQVPAGSR